MIAQFTAHLQPLTGTSLMVSHILLGLEQLTALRKQFCGALHRSVHNSSPMLSFITTCAVAPYGTREALICSMTTQKSTLDDADTAKSQQYVPCTITYRHIKV